jgi:hypothetical protein
MLGGEYSRVILCCLTECYRSFLVAYKIIHFSCAITLCQTIKYTAVLIQEKTHTIYPFQYGKRMPEAKCDTTAYYYEIYCITWVYIYIYYYTNNNKVRASFLLHHLPGIFSTIFCIIIMMGRYLLYVSYIPRYV